MTNRQLRDLLSTMADDVETVSVHDEAVSRSRGLARRRAVLASVAALVMVTGGVFGVTALADGPQRDERPADPTPDVRKIEGTYFQVDVGDGDSSERLVSWRAGDDEVTELIDAKDAGWGLFYRTGEVSPDGRYFSFLSPGTDEGGSAEDANSVMVVDLASKKIRKVADYSKQSDPCSPPVWSPDGERLYVDRGPGAEGDRTGYVDISTGDFTPYPVAEPCDLTVVSDAEGNDLVLSTAMGDGGAEVYATTADGDRNPLGVAAVVRDESFYVNDMVAASVDGRYVCVELGMETSEYHDGIKGRSSTCDTIVDTRDDATISFTTDDGFIPTGDQSMFAIPGRVLLESDDVTADEAAHVLYDMEGKALDEVKLALGDESLPLAFVPD